MTGRIIAMLVSLMFMGGCATAPLEIERARSVYENASQDPTLASHASVELYEAGKSVEAAERAWSRARDSGEAQTLSYVAERQVEIARAAAARKIAEAEISALGQERQDHLLGARTREVEIRAREAEQRAREAKLAQEDAERARSEAEARAAEAEAARREATEAAKRVAQLQREIEELGAKQTARGLVLTLGDVLFDTNRAELKSGALRNLDRLVAFLGEHPERAVLIEGHTDNTGAAAYNLDLSDRRSQSVRAFLIGKNIERGRVFARGFGESHPVASNASSGGRQQNRRVEIVILEPGEAAESAGREPVSSPPPEVSE